MVLDKKDLKNDEPKMITGCALRWQENVEKPLFTSNYAFIVNKKRQWLISESLTPLEAGEEGFEPPLTVLETVALPLNYSPSLLTQL